MVSSEEIHNRLQDKKEGKINGYLVCDNCSGFYELQADEKPKDFSSTCECGGQLNHSLTNTNTSSNKSPDYSKYSRDIYASYFLLILFVPLALIAGIYLVTRDNERAQKNGKIVVALSGAVLLVVLLRLFV